MKSISYSLLVIDAYFPSLPGGLPIICSDIFVNPQDAAHPVVNEISFSSGHYYRYTFSSFWVVVVEFMNRVAIDRIRFY
jgi:hypothetical protein